MGANPKVPSSALARAGALTEVSSGDAEAVTACGVPWGAMSTRRQDYDYLIKLLLIGDSGMLRGASAPSKVPGDSQSARTRSCSGEALR